MFSETYQAYDSQGRRDGLDIEENDKRGGYFYIGIPLIARRKEDGKDKEGTKYKTRINGKYWEICIG